MVRIAVKEVGKLWEIIPLIIDDSDVVLNIIHGILDGDVEVVNLSKEPVDLVMYVHGEKQKKESSVNFYMRLSNSEFVGRKTLQSVNGTVVVARTIRIDDELFFMDLTDEDIEYVGKFV